MTVETSSYNKFYEVSDAYRIVFYRCEDNTTHAYVKIYASSSQLYRKIIAFLYSAFTFKNAKVSHSWEYKHGFADGNEYLFNKNDQRLALGLVTRAYHMIRKGVTDIKVEFDKSIWDAYKKPGDDLTKDAVIEYCKSLDIKGIDNSPINPYEHQYKLIERAINGRLISLVACTSAGKSLSQYVMSRYLNEVEKKKVLLIVPSSGLVEQMYSDFKNDYGWKEIDSKCTLIHGESKDKLTKATKTMLNTLNLGEEVMLKDVVISTWQSLLAKPLKFFEVFGAVLIDEAHGAKADELKRIINQCVNADWKIGVSGTIPDDGLDAGLIEGAIGRREVIVRSKELIDKGILTPIQIVTLMIPYEEDIRKFICRQDYRSEYSMLINNGSRKQSIDVLIKSDKLPLDQNTLMLFKRKESIDDMKEFLEKNYPQYKIYVIKGEVAATLREKYRNEVNANEGCIILATYGTMKQGVNIKYLHNLVFVEFSKSMYEVVQSIGRVIRFHIRKKVAMVFDIVDDASYVTRSGCGQLKENYSMRHYTERKKYYSDDQFPVIEYIMPFTCTVNPEDANKKTKEAEKSAPKRKTVTGKGKTSKFMQ